MQEGLPILETQCLFPSIISVIIDLSLLILTFHNSSWSRKGVGYEQRILIGIVPDLNGFPC